MILYTQLYCIIFKIKSLFSKNIIAVYTILVGFTIDSCSCLWAQAAMPLMYGHRRHLGHDLGASNDHRSHRWLTASMLAATCTRSNLSSHCAEQGRA